MWDRWTSPDPMGGDLTNPQSLNRYAYVMNNPRSATDPLGLNCKTTDTCGMNQGAGYNDARPFYAGGCPSFFPADCNSTWPWNVSQEMLAGVAQYLEDNCIGCVSFQGTLYGQHVNTTFSTWDQYADWRSSVAALPQNRIYDAFWNLLENLGLDSTKEYPLTVFWWGLTPNVRYMGHPLNTALAAQGAIKDPLSLIIHGSPSWYKNSLFDTPHLVADPSGAQAHNDPFNGVLLAPLHGLFDYLPSFFINPKSQIPQNTSSWWCSGVGGCHQ